MLIVEDDERLRARLTAALTNRGFEVRAVGSVELARGELASETPEYALVDLRLPDGFGLQLVQLIHDRDPTTRIVVLTGFGTIGTALEAIRLGACHYLTKPVDADDIVAAFERRRPDATEARSAPSLDDVERDHIERVMDSCAGNVTQAARILGIHRRSLQRKLGKRSGGD